MNSKRRKKPVGAHVSDDLVIEILARLPTKSLRRFQCVSKAWRGFISDVFSGRKVFRPMSGLFFYYPDLLYSQHPDAFDRGTYAPTSAPQHDEDGFESRLRRLPFYSKAAVIHSSNGLLLFATCEYHYGHTGRCTYFVCNPTTMEFVTLPKRRRKHRLCFLAYNPRESPHYKVVRFTYDDGLRAIVEIYSSISRSWDEIFYDDRSSMCRWDVMSIFHKGFLHMLSNIPDHLVRFDVEEESFRVLPLPKMNRGFSYACIGVSRGHLYYAVNAYTHLELRIWMLHEGSSTRWLLKHRMSTEVFKEHPLTRDPASTETTENIRPIAFHPDSEVIYLSIPKMILAYHPSSGTLKEICRVRHILNWTKVFPVVPCLESIDPPGGKFIRR